MAHRTVIVFLCAIYFIKLIPSTDEMRGGGGR